MLPALWPGDLLFLESNFSEPLRLGDIVLFQRDGRFFIHRVVRLSSQSGNEEVITRGDCMAKEDFPVAKADVMGRVREVWRGERVMIPTAAPSLAQELLGWVLCHSNVAHRIALRWHAARQQESGFPAAASELRR